MWRELTEADVLSVLSEPEKLAYESAAAGSGQDVLAEITAGVVNHARGYIADNPVNSLAAGLTLPERVIRPALHLIRIDMLTRLDIEVSEDRRSAGKSAERFFEQVAAGKVEIERPAGAVDESSPQPRVKVVSNHERQATRENLAGL